MVYVEVMVLIIKVVVVLNQVHQVVMRHVDRLLNLMIVEFVVVII